ncbi:hypothetical protein GQ37_025220 [Janthinobacterium sp. BJB1]|jgi:hypothetical protein|uniref:Uncharacterized protein n=2 Tax=Janthinobacterium TaxID=29580 RepID=A0A1S1U3A3_9BURK|nr:hypothetical protein D9M09_24505 [Janthinobacterium agaricidamnosum]MDH6157093.1 hypothetical protein [Janthinobacterium sp. CG_23.4]OHV94932.1 hypothetical protein AKG95_21785 [Janthinobacterium lividum]PJC95413.1 hypothetical protein GQ37_027605 [Janthinobacterium sp. BJB1]PJC95973.1 hypothetical protein GQ37_025220 [Janthinobacterium sp. BJB1]
MPDRSVPVETCDEDQDTFERVRIQQGLDTIDQAIEWLIKDNVRIGIRKMSGRGRALYQVKRKNK